MLSVSKRSKDQKITAIAAKNNQPTLLPKELLTDITTFKAAIATKKLSYITTFYYTKTLLLKLI